MILSRNSVWSLSFNHSNWAGVFIQSSFSIIIRSWRRREEHNFFYPKTRMHSSRMHAPLAMHGPLPCIYVLLSTTHASLAKHSPLAHTPPFAMHTPLSSHMPPLGIHTVQRSLSPNEMCNCGSVIFCLIFCCNQRLRCRRFFAL